MTEAPGGAGGSLFSTEAPQKHPMTGVGIWKRESGLAPRGDFRGGVFISYRRALVGEHAERLFGVLTQKAKLPDRRVFFDQEAIPKGAVFPAEIEQAIQCAHLILIVIAPGWAENITARAASPEVDWVRREVGLALARSHSDDPPEIRVVLVGGAEMPTKLALPEELQALADINGTVLAGDAWHQDREALKDFLQDVEASVPWETEPLDESNREKLAAQCCTEILRRTAEWPKLDELKALHDGWQREFGVPKSISAAKTLNAFRGALENLSKENRTARAGLSPQQIRSLRQDCVAIVAQLFRLGACQLVSALGVLGDHNRPAPVQSLATQVFATAHSQGMRKAEIRLEPGTLKATKHFKVERTLDQGSVTKGILDDQSSSILDQLWDMIPEFKGEAPSYPKNPKNPDDVADLVVALDAMNDEQHAARVSIALQGSGGDLAGAQVLRKWLAKMGLDVDVLVRTGVSANDIKTEETALVQACWRCLKQIEGLGNE